MIDQPSSKQHWTSLKGALNKWRIAFLVLALTYFVFILLNLTRQPMNWDEVGHLNRALELQNGFYNNFVRDSFYPPLFSVLTKVSFDLFGASLFSARLVSAVFSVLSLWVVFELANTIYGKKVALLSAFLLAVMPGYFWLSRLALLEIMLIGYRFPSIKILLVFVLSGDLVLMGNIPNSIFLFSPLHRTHRMIKFMGGI